METSEPRSFSAPLSSASGRLVFRRGAANLTLNSDALNELYTAEFSEPIPEVRVLGNNIEITYRPNMSDWLKGWWVKDRTAATVTLNRSIPWQIEFKAGLSHLRADLSQMTLHALAIIGGASDVEILLPHVSVPLPVTVTGGASHIRLVHQAGNGAKLHIVGGATKVKLGEQYLGAMGGEIILLSPGYKDTEGRIDVEVKGGISDMDIVPA